MVHVCQVQIGLELTKAANSKRQVITGDGTSSIVHPSLESMCKASFLITTDDVNIALLDSMGTSWKNL